MDNSAPIFIDRKDRYYPARFVPTSRGGRKLLHNGFTYTINRKLNDNLSSWKCTKYKKCFCKARAVVRIIKNEEYVKITNRNSHSHDTEDEFAEFYLKQE